MKTIKRINNEFQHINPNETFYTFIEGAVRAIKIIKAELTYQWCNLNFSTNVQVHIKVAGLEGVRIISKQSCNNWWATIYVHRSIEGVMTAKPSTAFGIGTNVYPVNKNYRGIFYKWDGLKAVQVSLSTSCVIDLITGEETYKDVPDNYYITKEDCENDNAIKVVLFDEDEQTMCTTEMERERDQINAIIEDFVHRHHLKSAEFKVRVE